MSFYIRPSKTSSLIKDVRKRQFFVKQEMNKLILKSLLYNENNSFFFKLYFSKLFYERSINSSISRYRNYCVISGSSRSIFRLFKMSRHRCKVFASNGDIMGLRKSSF